ncbi:MAG: ShlB/FhaC/HecB family hemolysin secretion/activation protein [Gemmatimonadota bacterium]|nr:ShlB/FhaC/HecB family hemolysin secretion/activation protein [Gemmatimonadota bacterium]
MNPTTRTISRAFVAAAAAAICAPAIAAAQDDAWDTPTTLAIVDRAIQAREHAFADTALSRFEATAQGHIYFLGDFMGEREVVRADQVALQIRWHAPQNAIQTIVGRRHEVRLPTKIRYHIDHLSLVLDNFGDRIILGDGDEVWGVVHPASRGAGEEYQYRLADSLEIRIRDRTSRVYRLDVRPRNEARPGVVGSVFVDRETGAIARMALTFTASAYRDPELERITLDLRSALWEGRYWLPAEQHVEITRSVRWLDFPLESVIRTRLVVQDYDLDPAEEWRIAPGHRVATLPPDRLAAFPWWESPLYGGPLKAGERSDEELDLAVRNARSLVQPWSLERDQRLQFSLPNASSGLRLRRAEGALVGGGAKVRLDEASSVAGWLGYAAGAEQATATLSFDRRFGDWRAELVGFGHRYADVGWFAVASGVGQSVGLVVEGEDYSDPYFEDGGRVSFGTDGGVDFEAGLAVARQTSGFLVAESIFAAGRGLREVREIDDGTLVSLDFTADVRLGAAIGARWSLGLDAEGATAAIGDFGYSRAVLSLLAKRDRLGGPWAWSSELALGAAGGTLPAQRLFLLGGRGTLPGFDFRSWGGDRVALWRGEISRSLAWPWVTIRAIGAVGWAESVLAGAAAAERFGVGDTEVVRGSLGGGFGVLYDLLRIEVARGIGSAGPDDALAGDWTLFLTINPLFWNVL